MFGSDYGGDHKKSNFRTYCYLIVDEDYSPEWPIYRREFRKQFLPDGRRMSFKGLNDGQRKRALAPFLATANALNGHLVGLIVTKEVEFMSTSAQMLERWGTLLNLKGRWNKTSFESVCRTALFFALLVSLWSRQGMDLTWITDEDEVVANDARLDDAQLLAAQFCSLYSPHSFGTFAMNSTRVDDKGRAFEDFVAIADLAAGMLCEIAGKVARTGNVISPAFQVGNNVISEKSDIIADWFWYPSSPLKRTAILIDRHDNKSFRVQKLTMDYEGTPQA